MQKQQFKIRKDKFKTINSSKITPKNNENKFSYAEAIEGINSNNIRSIVVAIKMKLKNELNLNKLEEK